MKMCAREWEQVRDALIRLGCTVYHETENQIHLAYKNTLWWALRKSPVPVPAQKDILRKFDISEQEYLKAIEDGMV